MPLETQHLNLLHKGQQIQFILSNSYSKVEVRKLFLGVIGLQSESIPSGTTKLIKWSRVYTGLEFNLYTWFGDICSCCC